MLLHSNCMRFNLRHGSYYDRRIVWLGTEPNGTEWNGKTDEYSIDHMYQPAAAGLGNCNVNTYQGSPIPQLHL